MTTCKTCGRPGAMVQADSDIGKHNKAIREASDNVVGEDKLVSFFYELMRDHMPPGRVEEIVRRVLDEDPEIRYCNGWLAKNAEFIVERLGRREDGKDDSSNGE